MAGLFDYVSETLSRGDYPDVGGTMETLATYKDPVIDRWDSMIDQQALVDNTDMFVAGLLGLGGKMAARETVGRSMFMPTKTPVDTTWSRELADRYGEQFAKDYWMKQEAAKRGKLYTTEVLNDFYTPSKLETAINTLYRVNENPYVNSSVRTGSFGYGYKDRLLGDNNE